VRPGGIKPRQEQIPVIAKGAYDLTHDLRDPFE